MAAQRLTKPSLAGPSLRGSLKVPPQHQARVRAYTQTRLEEATCSCYALARNGMT